MQGKSCDDNTISGPEKPGALLWCDNNLLIINDNILFLPQPGRFGIFGGLLSPV